MRRLSPEQVRRIKAMRADGYSQHATAVAVGCTRGTVRKYAPGYIGKVDNAPLREAFLASNRTASDIARSVGWLDRGSPDTSRVRRALGLRDDLSGTNGIRSRRRLIDAETAGLIAEALGMGAWEIEEAA